MGIMVSYMHGRREQRRKTACKMHTPEAIQRTKLRFQSYELTHPQNECSRRLLKGTIALVIAFFSSKLKISSSLIPASPNFFSSPISALFFRVRCLFA